ncbi:MAG: histidine phosphatase family protein [Lachnospiraceae bacterium]|nr:histidine phosphatase family protein [Lachnospiraceae bacterium]
MEIYIVRHGQTMWNKEKRLQGSVDIELNDNGKELAIITGQNLMDTTIDIIYSSPLKRAHETARLIRNGRDINIITDDRLRELNFGSMEGVCYEQLYQEKTHGFKYFFTEPHLYYPPKDGETLNHLCDRASEFMSQVIEPLEATCERVMIVAHGAMNKALMTHVKKHSLEDFWSGGLQKNCNVIILDYTQGKYTIIDETRTFY